MAKMEIEQSGLEHPREPSVPAEDVEQPVDEEQWIRQSSSLLLEFLEREPGAMQGIERIIEGHLRGGVNTETGEMLFNSLVLYAGEDTANFLLMLLARGVDDPELLAQVKSHLDGEVWTSVRTLLALYGRTVKEAYLLGGENPNGWRDIKRQVYYDLMSSQWRITFEIIKRNGERTLYEENPTSLLVLADAILDTLNGMPSDIAPDVVDPGSLENFMSTCATFLDLYAPGAVEQGQEEGIPESTEEMPR